MDNFYHRAHESWVEKTDEVYLVAIPYEDMSDLVNEWLVKTKEIMGTSSPEIKMELANVGRAIDDLISFTD